jgi:hypothetical protein
MSERDMQALLALIERNLGRGYLEFADWLRDQTDLGEIEQAIRTGDWAAVSTKLEAAALRMAAEIQGSYIQAGQAAALWLDKQPQTADKLIRFDVANDRAVARDRANQLELVQGYTAEQRETTRQVLAEGRAVGANPRDMARDIREGLSLTPAQAQHVRSYRRQLETGQFAEAMGRQLHDGRSDARLNRLAEQGKSLTPAQVDKLVDGYREAYVGYRAEVIARTESLRSVHEASAENIRQAVERGDLDAADITLEWHAAGDARTRESHRAMNGQQRAYGEAFTTGTGVTLRYPGDPAAPVAETAQCRCAVSTSLL